MVIKKDYPHCTLDTFIGAQIIPFNISINVEWLIGPTLCWLTSPLQ